MMSEEAKRKSAEEVARQAEIAEKEKREREKGKRYGDRWMKGKRSSIDWNVVQI